MKMPSLGHTSALQSSACAVAGATAAVAALGWCWASLGPRTPGFDAQLVTQPKSQHDGQCAATGTHLQQPEHEVQPQVAGAAPSHITPLNAEVWLPPDFPDAIATGQWPSPKTMVVPIASSGDALANQAAITFNTLGLCLVRSLLPPEFAEKCRIAAQQSFDDLMGQFAVRGVSLGERTKGGYKEIVKRTSGRYEMLYQMQSGIFDASAQGQLGRLLRSTWLHDFLSRTIGPDWRLMRQALLVSFPGASLQQWHVDGDHTHSRQHLPCHAMNVFIALDEISIDMGPTELRPASHFLTRDLAKQMMLAKIKKRLHPTIKPCSHAGDAVIFDYRTLHRGLPNDSGDMKTSHSASKWEDGMLWGNCGDWAGRARPMLELTFANKRYTDLLNFPPRSIFDQPTSRA